jgi:membrane-associated phospholipid phosphatase
MTSFEWLPIVYFVAMAAAARAPLRSRGTLYTAAAIAALVILASFTLPWPARAWMPHAYLVLGYWIPATLTSGPNPAFERWLTRTDVPRAFQVPGAGIVRQVLELAYLCCYPLVPAGFVVVFAAGTRDDITRFWLVVLTSGYVCYASLPWTAARPPRVLAERERRRGPPGLAAVNAHVLERVSHQFVTFPSGHVAVSLAVAAAVWRVWPAAGALFGVIALLIAIAAVAGRYHYLMDVLLGLAVGALVPLLVG